MGSPRNVAMVEQYLEWMAVNRHRTNTTLYSYATRLNYYLDWIGDLWLGDVPLEEAEAFVVRPVYKHGPDGRPRAAASTSKDAAILRGLYKWLHGRGHIDHNPLLLLQGPTVENELPKPVEREVWAQMEAGVDACGIDARVCEGLMFYCGLRRQELVRLGPHHVDARSGLLVAFGRKGHKGRQATLPYRELVEFFHDADPELCPDPEPFLEGLAWLAHKRQGSRLLLPWKRQNSAVATVKHSLADGDIDPDLVNINMRRWLVQRGLERTSVTPHRLRHGFCTYLLHNGVPLEMVSRLANHRSLDMTMRYARLVASDFGTWRASVARQTSDTTEASGQDRRLVLARYR